MAKNGARFASRAPGQQYANQGIHPVPRSLQNDFAMLARAANPFERVGTGSAIGSAAGCDLSAAGICIGCAWIAVSPLLVALLRARAAETLQLDGHRQARLPATPWQGFLLGYLCGILWFAGNCYWIYDTMHRYGGLPVPVAVLFADSVLHVHRALSRAVWAAGGLVGSPDASWRRCGARWRRLRFFGWR